MDSLASSSSDSRNRVVVIILLIAGIALGCYVYRMRKTFSLATGTIKKITDKPLSGCRRLFLQDAQAHPTCYVSMYYMTTKDYRRQTRSPCSRNTSSADDKNLEGCFPGPSGGSQVCEAPRQEGTGRLFCITGTRNRFRSREYHRHSRLIGNFPEAV